MCFYVVLYKKILMLLNSVEQNRIAVKKNKC